MPKVLTCKAGPRTTYVALDRHGEPRPAVDYDPKGYVMQALFPKDRVLKGVERGARFIITDMSTGNIMSPDDVGKDVALFLRGRRKHPFAPNWDGQVLKDTALSLSMDKYLQGFNSHELLVGLLGLTSRPVNHVGHYDLDKLYHGFQAVRRPAPKPSQVKNLLKSLDVNHRDWLLQDGVSLANTSWRNAKALPKMVSVSILIDEKGEPILYNELVIYRKGQSEPEVVSLLDMLDFMAGKGSNFLSLPYEITGQDDIERVMYILHDSKKNQRRVVDTCNTIWLFRKR